LPGTATPAAYEEKEDVGMPLEAPHGLAHFLEAVDEPGVARVHDDELA
jgi:hypothetical protein